MTIHHAATHRIRQRLFMLFAAIALPLMTWIGAVEANTWSKPDMLLYVTNYEGAGYGSLPQTIRMAPPHATIRFQQTSCEREFKLEAPLVIDKPLTLEGYGAECIVISGQGKTRVFEVQSIEVFFEQISIREGFAEQGSAMYIYPGSEVIMRDVEFDRNQADEGAVYNAGSLTLLASAMWRNESTKIGSALVTTSTGSTQLINTTLAENATTAEGGAVAAYGDVYMVHTTIANNRATRGGGIWVGKTGNVTIQNSIVAHNKGEPGTENCFKEEGGLLGGTANLEFGSTEQTCLEAGFRVDDPQLASIARNAPGQTRNLAIDETSPALDAAIPSLCAIPFVARRDQRGAQRPQGKGCDIGAYEVGNLIEITPTPTNTRRPSRTPRPTITSTPTITPTPTITLTPSRTVPPSRTPRPSLTPRPTNTPRPSRTPRPTATPRPSRTPTATR